MIRFICAVTYLVTFLVCSLPLVLVEVILGWVAPKKKDRMAYHVIQTAFKIALWICGAKVEVRGKENLPENGEAVLYVSNHRSYFDIIAGYTVVPDITGFVAKKETKKAPIFAWWMMFIHCLFLDRSDVRAGLKTILDGVEKIKSGVSLWICPEGTRNKKEDVTDMLEFKAGSFKLAEKSGCRIIPVAISGTAEIWELHFPKVKPSKVIIEFGTPIDTPSLSRDEKKVLHETTKQMIYEMLVKQKQERETLDK